jgi:DNA-binding CsgD family transcriptional regulator
MNGGNNAHDNDISAAVEAERRRLSALVESGIVNPLNLLLSQANVYEQTMGANPQAMMAVSVMASLIRQTLQKARDLQDNLNPSILEALGLEPALEALASQQTRAYGLHISLNLERLRQRLPAPVELAVYRAAQDVLERATTQAHASHVTMRLLRQSESILFEYSDDGVSRAGTDVLNGLNQRITQAGGKCKASFSTQGELLLSITFSLGEEVDLTPRELDILARLAEGMSNKEIAAALHLSARTVNFHLDNLYSKLGVNTRTEAVVQAMRRGILQRPG